MERFMGLLPRIVRHMLQTSCQQTDLSFHIVAGESNGYRRFYSFPVMVAVALEVNTSKSNHET